MPFLGIKPSYNKESPATSTSGGVLLSASWGRPKHNFNRCKLNVYEFIRNI
jgi:hypothetical protein